jgi:hypothetical protein
VWPFWRVEILGKKAHFEMWLKENGKGPPSKIEVKLLIYKSWNAWEKENLFWPWGLINWIAWRYLMALNFE